MIKQLAFLLILATCPCLGCSKTAKPKDGERLASLEKCRDIASKQPWGTSLQQIPATVIDKGVLQNVPYTSLQAGSYEVNVYGDPDHPAGVEVGIRKELLGDSAAEEKCIAFIQAVLLDADDQREARLISRAIETRKRNGLTFETTPPTSEDAYGGWWVSVYDEALLEKSRASAKELEAITQQKAQPQTGPPAKIPATQPAEDAPWSGDDMKLARSGEASTSSSSGRVYVRGYTRKDGTYVSGHSRRR